MEIRMSDKKTEMRYLSLDKVAEKFVPKRAKSTLYRDMKSPDWPKPYRIGGSVYWLECEIDAMLQKKRK